jgi:hypothetical protein
MPKPEEKFRCGACEAAIFENEIQMGGRKIKLKKVAFQKRYKSAEGEWKSTQNLDANDIPKAVIVLNKAYEYLLMGNGADGRESTEEL